MDSDSTDTVFCNPDYVTDIKETKQSLKLQTNGGVMTSSKKCNIPMLGNHWFNENSITNIISLADMIEKHRVTYDSAKEKAFLVHLPEKVVKFEQMDNGLYAMDPTKNHQKERTLSKYQLFETVENNLNVLTARQQLETTLRSF